MFFMTDIFDLLSKPRKKKNLLKLALRKLDRIEKYLYDREGSSPSSSLPSSFSASQNASQKKLTSFNTSKLSGSLSRSSLSSSRPRSSLSSLRSHPSSMQSSSLSPSSPSFSSPSFSRKESIQNAILELCSREDLTPSALKNRVVQELALCSKASFYRYFDELKRRKRISIMNVNGEELVYLLQHSLEETN